MEAISRTEIGLLPDSIDQYLTSISYRSPRTIATYQNILYTIQKNLVLPIEVASIDELMELLEDFGKHYESPTMNVIRAVLRGYLKFCGREDDAKRIKYATLKWMPRQDLSQEQLDRVLAQAWVNERAVILTLYSTGARLGEITSKRFDKTRPTLADLDWVTGKIKIIGKGGRPDYLVFFPRRQEAIEALHLYIGSRQSGPILPNRRRSYFLVRRAGDRVGVKLHPHMLRHAGAHSLIMQNVSTRIVQAWIRHCSLEMTMRYTFMAKSDLIDLAQQKEWR